MLGVKTAWEYAQKQATVVANSIQRLHWVIIMFSIRFSYEFSFTYSNLKSEFK